MVPLAFDDPSDLEGIEQGDELVLENLRQGLEQGDSIELSNKSTGSTFKARHTLSELQVEMVLAGGLIPLLRREKSG